MNPLLDMVVKLRGQHHSIIMCWRILVSWNYLLGMFLFNKMYWLYRKRKGSIKSKGCFLQLKFHPCSQRVTRVLWSFEWQWHPLPLFISASAFWLLLLITVTWLHLPQKSQRAFLFFPCKQCLSFAAKTKDSISQKQDPRHLSMPLQSCSFESWVKRPIPCLSL